MPRVTVNRTINAPVDRVFKTVADIRNFSEAIPHIVNIKFLTEQKSGVGTRFRETRLMKGKEATTELEVTEFVENEKIRLVADSHGTVWDTIFTVEPDGDQTQLKMVMDANAYKLIAGLMNRLIVPLIRGAVEADMDSVKVHCEKVKSDPQPEA